MTSIDRVKTHLKNNKKVYLVGAGSLALGVAATAIIMRKQIVINDSFNMSLHSPKENIVTTILERRGHPGFIVKNLTTGETFASIRRAADVYDINPGKLSHHLADGKVANIAGYAFQVLGEAV